MRGVAGILFIGVGFMVAYLVISGQLPTSNPLVGTPLSTSEPAIGNTAAKQGAILANKNIGSGPTGLPTMAHFNDLVASRGGMA